MRKRYDFNIDDRYFGENIPLDGGERRKSIHSIPFFAGLAFIGYLFCIFLVAIYFDESLPRPLNEENEKLQYPDAFITERAVQNLKELTSFGPRVLGSKENEVLAVEFLKREINTIITNANGIHKIESDIQVVSGVYTLLYKPTASINTYSNVQNVVVKFHAKNPTENSLLINSHFDSVPTSPGGSDDGINVVVMLEILRKLSRSSEQFEHNIIFLFNGAEETPLQAAHGFITQHKWAKDCKVIINLEAAGAGGKIILFQTGPKTPWLMDYYAKVPHPYGQAAGEEIFQSGLIPSDTDFRIFRDFGGLVGYDMAFYKNGYRYHTKFDGFENIPQGSYQHCGDNTLSLIKNVANAPELGSKVTIRSNAVYFDVFGWFMISYSTFWAFFINLSVSVISFGLFAFNLYQYKLGHFSSSTTQYLILASLAIIFGWGVSFLFTVALALVLDILNFTMSWYANPWIVFGLYAIPTIALNTVFIAYTNLEHVSLNIRCLIQLQLVRIIWTILLVVGTFFQLRSVYALLIPIIFNCFAFVIIGIFKLQHTKILWQLIVILSMFLPTLLLMYCTNITLSLFIPIAGRMGAIKNPEIYIGCISTFFTILSTSYYIPFSILLKDYKYFLAALAGVFLVFFVIVFTPLGFPYSGNIDSPAPQRQWIIHTSRSFHNENGKIEKEDGGVYLLNMDRNSPHKIQEYVKDISKAVPLECDKYLLCGLPLPHIKATEIIKKSTWIPSSPPALRNVVKLVVNSKQRLPDNIIRYNISATGPDRLSIYLFPKKDVQLLNISLVHELPEQYLYNGKPLYFISHTFGKIAEQLNVVFEVKVPTDDMETALDVALTGIYVHGNEDGKTAYFLEFLNQFPEWTDITAMLGSYSLYVL